MCRILMPINPKFVSEILNGNKKYEYRKIKAKKENVDKMLIYSTSPVMKVVAEVDIKDILEKDPATLWEMTKDKSGITKDFYNEYYENRKMAIAYKLGEVIVYDKPLNLSDLGINYIPQSFVYLD